MRFSYSNIPKVAKLYRQEIRDELMGIYNDRYPEEICTECGKPFRKHKRTQLTCSPSCSIKRSHRLTRESEKQKNPMPLKPRVCECCGAVFKPTNGRQLFCSVECRKVAAGERKREEVTEVYDEPYVMIESHLVEKETKAREMGRSYGWLQMQETLKNQWRKDNAY